ncbi:hypothetical protein WJX81_000091 [Elliptochloris bilobata]|uniref:Fe2OG dioxygenase domain-containing protein n=1 Tax=Elliptochloris bilobata TaxID=381761 RepID=A0AAW1R1T5_9CHLO
MENTAYGERLASVRFRQSQAQEHRNAELQRHVVVLAECDQHIVALVEEEAALLQSRREAFASEQKGDRALPARQAAELPPTDMPRLGEPRAAPPGFPAPAAGARLSPRPNPSPKPTTLERRGVTDMPQRELRGLLVGRGRREPAASAVAPPARITDTRPYAGRAELLGGPPLAAPDGGRWADSSPPRETGPTPNPQVSGAGFGPGHHLEALFMRAEAAAGLSAPGGPIGSGGAPAVATNAVGARSGVDWAADTLPVSAVSEAFEDAFPGVRRGTPAAPPIKQKWMEDSQWREAEFPTLGGSGAAARPAGAWGGGLAAKLRAAEPAASVAVPAAPARLPVEEYEEMCKLRKKGDPRDDRKRRSLVHAKKDFEYIEGAKVNGVFQRCVNVVDGLELHQEVLSIAEQAMMVDHIEQWVALGRADKLRRRTFSAPRRWAKGKGRVTVQYGCCYNYADGQEGRRPGIIPEEVVEPLPPVLQALVRRLVRWGVLPAFKAPDSAIINIYEPQDCIPPHIDHHDFMRPFCTLSLLSGESIMFGARLVPEGPGHFVGSTFYLPLPVGSCLVLKGNGGDVAMHCVPPVERRRMSITLRRMGNQFGEKVRNEIKRIQRQEGPSQALAPRRYGTDDYEDSEPEAGRSSRRGSWR